MAKPGFGTVKGTREDHRLTCPKCDERMELVMRVPGRRMWWNCKCGHEQPKMKNDFRR